jgi:hypothetical protein
MWPSRGFVFIVNSRFAKAPYGRSGHTKLQRSCSPVASRFGQSAFSISRHFIMLPLRPTRPASPHSTSSRLWQSPHCFFGADAPSFVGGTCGEASGVAMEIPKRRHCPPTTWNRRSKLICIGRVGI